MSGVYLIVGIITCACMGFAAWGWFLCRSGTLAERGGHVAEDVGPDGLWMDDESYGGTDD